MHGDLDWNGDTRDLMRVVLCWFITIASLSAAPRSTAETIAGVQMPSRPTLGVADYPGCAADYTKYRQFAAQVQAVQDCINDLEAFNSIALPAFVNRMRGYVASLQSLSAAKLKDRTISSRARQSVAEYVRDETLRSDVNSGEYFTVYRLLVARYRSQLRSLVQVRVRQQFPQN